MALGIVPDQYEMWLCSQVANLPMKYHRRNTKPLSQNTSWVCIGTQKWGKQLRSRKGKKRGKDIPVNRTSRFPHFVDNQSAAMSTLHAGRPLLQLRFLVHTSVSGWVDFRIMGKLKVLRQLKNLIGKWTRDLPARLCNKNMAQIFPSTADRH